MGIKKVVEIATPLREVVGEEWVVTERSMMETYLRDETPNTISPSPASDLVLVKPANTAEVSEILKIANEERVPIFPVGGRTGLAGGSVPVKPGIIVSLERMNSIEVDTKNLTATAEAGATLEDLLRAAEDAGLFFPLHPGDEGAQIGGLIATNAGGVRAIKHGIMRNYVKGLEVVLPTGETLTLGGNLTKNNTGYSLMHLMIGSEGTLGVITKAIIKLFPRPGITATLIAPFERRQDALQSVMKILQSTITPLAIEYVEWDDIERTVEHLRVKWPAKGEKAQLIIILSEANEDALFSACEDISKVCEENNVREILIAETKEEQEKILRIRSNTYTAIKPYVYDILDVTVPPSKTGELMDRVEAIAEEYSTWIPTYGHVGDGNLHVHIMKEEGRGVEFYGKIKKKIYEACIGLGGVITGEHGIGKVKIKDAPLVLSEKEIELMRTIKTVFDPNNTMNPGTIAG